MLSPTPRLGLARMNADGSDLVDVVNQYNANWQAMDDRFIPAVGNGVTRPSGQSQGLLLNENGTVSHLMSLGSNEWTTFGSTGLTYETYDLNPTSNPIASGVDTSYNIGNPALSNKCFQGSPGGNSIYVRLLNPGVYILSAAISWIAEVNAPGHYYLNMDFHDTGGGFLTGIQQTTIRGNESAPVALSINTLYRVTTPTQEDVRISTFQNSGNPRTVFVGGSTANWTNFKAMYVRPLIQGV